jgi:hypothetical protein
MQFFLERLRNEVGHEAVHAAAVAGHRAVEVVGPDDDVGWPTVICTAPNTTADNTTVIFTRSFIWFSP